MSHRHGTIVVSPESLAGLSRDLRDLAVHVDGVESDEVARAVAVAAVAVWEGAGVIVTRHVPQVLRAVEMASSIRGDRAPAWAVRGLG